MTPSSLVGSGNALAESLQLIDLFCGAGGMTLGFTSAFGHSCRPVWANDHDPSAAATYNSNYGPHCVVGNIAELLERPDIDVPVCVTSEQFGVLLYRILGQARRPVVWPMSIEQLHVEAVDTVAGVAATGLRHELGPSGIWLRVRVSALGNLRFGDASPRSFDRTNGQS